ncbi:MAG: SAM-dependent methyltransferase [candidate division KSB1 bacterium]|nr:SAM-dependent methyltransferase [candidate division KSB1 bacterium]MDZ7275567.1 SAM-dependent methyltransferase [candidate division KSB1 bacterium]MDZ7286121.1 SAM-dependent methyltransferase [candidate division KSB1 bacterium]MDZ7296347.1 SAM-dependent methyltransferase [candidate division KSB1 bacterium]MDZ7347214.1 SAM-dependent methyltransferase [candidate division KSB1 bacterium]
MIQQEMTSPMRLDTEKTRQTLRNFDFKTLFIDLLGWDRHSTLHEITIDSKNFSLRAVAQKRGVVAFLYDAAANGGIPDYQMRKRIERAVEKSHHEHLIIFVDEKAGNQIWQWVKREPGKPLATREHAYHCSQPGDALIQKLQNLAFSIEDEERLTIIDVTGRLRGFDIERVTRRFYDQFKTEHAGFTKFIQGIPDENLQSWYASFMLDRLMFIYFVQKKNFLDGDPDYLRTKLEQSRKRGPNRYYREFLCCLFFEGFAKRECERSPATRQLLGKVPYLNGGLFLPHQIEEQYGDRIRIADTAFVELYDFFGQWHWHLDDRPLRNDREINPDVLGYIFEKYVNQKQMGAYYTKEDITEYIGKNTIIPFIFDAAEKRYPAAFKGENAVWRLLQEDPDRYIYNAVKHGIAVNVHENPPAILQEPLALPAEIAAGIASVPKRTEWNKPAPRQFALPTEIWRKVVARRQRYEEVWGKMTRGEVQSINDLITYNLNIRQFVQDVIVRCDDPASLHAIYRAIEKLTVLDPTCGSGAFLFAALNILEPLYEACLDRMEAFLAENAGTNGKQNADPLNDFRKILTRVAEHSNRRYFILKAIIVNNLFGVDIMEEAVEICKLRLFLKLAAQAEKDDAKPNLGIEPLPDIDFNIRAGNTLVGFATQQEVKDWITLELKTGQYKMRQLLSGDALERIEMKAQTVDDLFASFRQQQTEDNTNATPIEKKKLQKKLDELRDELNRYLAAEYGISHDQPSAYDKWLKSHKPFHWFVEFYGVMKSGGFDVIIGNPPYVGEKRGVSQFFPLAELLLSQTAGEILFDEGKTRRGTHPPSARPHGTPPGEFCAKIRSDSPRGKMWFTEGIRLQEGHGRLSGS